MSNSKNYLAILIVLFPCLVFSHARLTSPAPRSNSAGIKNGPCGGIARTANPTTVTGGTMLNVNWEETIDHPGKYIISLSMKDDIGFDKNILKQVLDTQDNRANVPHRYTTQVPLPDIDCATCTLQLIQSMEENPAAPTYYYSCADLKIAKSTSPPPPITPPPITPPPDNGGNIQVQTVVPQSNQKITIGSGCGSIHKMQSSPEQGPFGMLSTLFLLLLFLLPVVLVYFLRSSVAIQRF